jgi:hypothetical protein
MHPDRFDAVTKALAGGLSRRGLLRRASAIAGASFLGLGISRSTGAPHAFSHADEPDLEERSVQLFEALAALAVDHATSCDELAAATQQFSIDHQEELARIRASEDAWSFAHRYGHSVTYADRRQQAIDQLQAVMRGCAGDEPSASPASETNVLPGTGSRQLMDNPTVRTLGAPALGAAAQVCAQNVWPPDARVMCHVIGGDWYSPRFYWPINCPEARISEECAFCPEGDLNGNVFCNEHWPDQCPLDRPCGMALHVTCCEQTCPISTGDCVTNWAAGIGGGVACDTCMTGWCGSYDHCIQDCDSSDCCNTPCSSSYVPPPPAGEVQVGTPIPDSGNPPPGTPIPLASPVVT